MVEYVNELHRLVVECLTKRISPNVNQLKGGCVMVGEAVVVDTYFGFDKTGEFFVYAMSRSGFFDPTLDHIVGRALADLKDFDVRRNRLSDKVIMYFVRPEMSL